MNCQAPNEISLVATMRIAPPKPCNISLEPSPRDVQADDALYRAGADECVSVLDWIGLD